MLWHQNSECQTTPTEFWCHGISGAKLHFADVAPLLEFGTKRWLEVSVEMMVEVDPVAVSSRLEVSDDSGAIGGQQIEVYKQNKEEEAENAKKEEDELFKVLKQEAL
ncbi:hypothetical protein Tco_1194714 [Tanacetum coccineum]